MNYLKALKTLAKYTDPQSVDAYDAHIRTIGLIMEILTLALFASFGGVAIKKFALRAQEVKHRVSRGLSSADGEAPQIMTKKMVMRRAKDLKGRILRGLSGAEAPQLESSQTKRSSGALSVEMAEQGEVPKSMHLNPMSSNRDLGGSSASLPAGWTSETTSGGKQYFYNKKSGKYLCLNSILEFGCLTIGFSQQCAQARRRGKLQTPPSLDVCGEQEGVVSRGLSPSSRDVRALARPQRTVDF